MEVILRQDVEKVGRAGDVVKVKDGFARNLLLPRGLALLATKNNLKKVEFDKKKKEDVSAKERKDAEALATKLSGLSLTLAMQVHEEEKLYGSVTTLEIAKVLEDEGYSIDKKYILLDSPIKALGIYEVPIKLHPEVIAKIKLWVVKK